MSRKVVSSSDAPRRQRGELLARHFQIVLKGGAVLGRGRRERAGQGFKHTPRSKTHSLRPDIHLFHLSPHLPSSTFLCMSVASISQSVPPGLGPATWYSSSRGSWRCHSFDHLHLNKSDPATPTKDRSRAKARGAKLISATRSRRSSRSGPCSLRTCSCSCHAGRC